jgi:hypothetical protein
VATSDGFWSTAVGRWVGATKNLTGLGLAVLALGAHLAFGLGPLWPLVVVAAYGVGALVAPRDRVDLRLGLGAAASAAQLRDQLGVLRRSLRGPAGRLDADLRTSLDGVLGNLDEIVAHWDELAGAPDQQHTVAQMIADYLPTSVQAYLNLPRAVTATRVAGRRSAHDELADQLGILSAESGRIRDAVYARTVEALTDQGRFLRDKFHRSELDLGPGQ